MAILFSNNGNITVEGKPWELVGVPAEAYYFIYKGKLDSVGGKFSFISRNDVTDVYYYARSDGIWFLTCLVHKTHYFYRRYVRYEILRWLNQKGVIHTPEHSYMSFWDLFPTVRKRIDERNSRKIQELIASYNLHK